LKATLLPKREIKNATLFEIIFLKRALKIMPCIISGKSFCAQKLLPEPKVSEAKYSLSCPSCPKKKA